MYTKFLVVIVLVAGLVVAGKTLLGRHSSAVQPGGGNIVLVPKTLAGAPMLKHWHNSLSGGIVEVGALYAASRFGPTPALLDFRRGSQGTHNGIGCFLDQGETLDSEQLHTLPTASGRVVFDVGILRTPGQVRLIAATECTASTCTTDKLPFLAHFWKQWSLKHLMAGQPNGVVPVAIILTRKTGRLSPDVVIAELQAELEKVAAAVDLAPAKRLAKVQAGDTAQAKPDVAAN